MACRKFVCSERLTVAPVYNEQSRVTETCRREAGLREREHPEKRSEDLADWIRQRKELRRSLDRLGDVDGWLYRKPILTELENMLMEQREAMRKKPRLPQLLSDTVKLSRPPQTVVKKKFRRLPSKQLQRQKNTDPTASTCSDTTEEERDKQKDIQRGHRGGEKQDKEVLVTQKLVNMSSETLNTHSSPSTLRGPTGRAVEHFRKQNLAEYLDSLEQCQKHNLLISQATLQRGFLHPGDVSVYKRLAIRQVGSRALSGCGRRLKDSAFYSNLLSERKEEEDNEEEDDSAPHKVYKEMSRRYPLSWRADPDAFWPGRESHVRLYEPVTSHRSANVLFQLIEHTSALSPGHWPVNQAGYSTSGDINRHKVYIL